VLDPNTGQPKEEAQAKPEARSVEDEANALADSSKTDEEAAPDNDGEAEDHRLAAMNKRIYKQREKIRERTARIAELERELESARQVKDKAPDVADFDDYDDYEAALQEHEGKVKPVPANNTLQAAIADVMDKADDWDERPDDFDAAVTSKDVEFSDKLIVLASDFDEAPAILYHLAKNPSEAKRLSRMKSSEVMALALKGVADSLNRKAAPEPVRERKIGAINPVGGGGAPNAQSLADMSVEDHSAQIRNTGARRFR